MGSGSSALEFEECVAGLKRSALKYEVASDLAKRREQRSLTDCRASRKVGNVAMTRSHAGAACNHRKHADMMTRNAMHIMKMHDDFVVNQQLHEVSEQVNFIMKRCTFRQLDPEQMVKNMQVFEQMVKKDEITQQAFGSKPQYDTTEVQDILDQIEQEELLGVESDMVSVPTRNVEYPIVRPSVSPVPPPSNRASSEHK